MPRRFQFSAAPAPDDPLPGRAPVPADIRTAVTGPLPGISMRCDAIVKVHPSYSQPQGYRIEIRPNQILILAGNEAGAFYGLMTLRQLASLGFETWPCGIIEDAPDYPSRGVMLDISRDKVPTMDTLRMIVDELATWKINHLELYTEHTFAYSGHRAVGDHASPMTPSEILQLDTWCRERFIELVPNQNLFGHFERWLKHPGYRHLAFDPQHPSCLDPRHPGCLPLLEELYDELLPLFSSTKFNVGCDETQVHGTDYIEFLRSIHTLVTRRDHVMHFWDDIVIRQPELVHQLPRDLVALEWGYEAAHPFDEHGSQLARAGIPFYVCPGTSSWASLGGRTDNCLANIRNAAVNGLRHRAIGFLNTDWGDHGHWQYWPVSYTGILAGAAMSWCVASNTHGSSSTDASRSRPNVEQPSTVARRNRRMRSVAFVPGTSSSSTFRLQYCSSAASQAGFSRTVKMKSAPGYTRSKWGGEPRCGNVGDPIHTAAAE